MISNRFVNELMDEIKQLKAELATVKADHDIHLEAANRWSEEAFRLRADIEKLIANGELAAETYILSQRDMNAEIERLRAELVACREDAERYRWLRGDAPETSTRWSRWRIEHWSPQATWGDLRGVNLDTAIDEAREKE